VVAAECRAWAQIVRDNVDDAGPPSSAVEQLHLLTGQLFYIHRYSPETVAKNEKREKYTKTNYLQDIQFRHHTQWSLRIKLSFRCAICLLGILKLNIN